MTVSFYAINQINEIEDMEQLFSIFDSTSTSVLYNLWFKIADFCYCDLITCSKKEALSCIISCMAEE